MAKLAEETNAEKIMLQSLIRIAYGEMGKVDYQFLDPDHVKDHKARDGYLVGFFSFYFKAPPFVLKPTPFEPHLLYEICGDAGYDYYVE
jgi:hypothetical protein